VYKVTKEGEGRFQTDFIKGKEGGKEKYARNWIYIPVHVATDSEFPFKNGDRLRISFEGKKVIAELLPEKQP